MYIVCIVLYQKLCIMIRTLASIIIVTLFLNIGNNNGTPILVEPENNFLIVGGSEVVPHEFPWLVSLHWQEGQFCSGVIVSPIAVVTTASCASLITAYYLEIYAGLHLLSQNETVGVQKRNPQTILHHPNYPAGPKGLGNDIAILKLAVSQAFVFDEYVNAIELPEIGQVAEGSGIIAGWGSVSVEAIKLQDAPTKAEVQVLSDAQCEGAYGKDFNATSMLCAGGRGADFCNGDVGGPLVARDTLGRLYLAGIASWGQGCGNPFFPGVYTEISSFLEFITANM